MEGNLRVWITALCLLLGACAGAPPAREAEPPPPASPGPVPAAEPSPAVPERPTVDTGAARPAPRPEPVRPPPPAPPPAPLSEGERFVCPPGDTVTARKRWLNAINALQGGDASGARTELELALCREPENKTALSLLQQIDQPAEALFGSEWAEYTVQPGDTLSKISEKFLGDPLLFYGLARYNRIENPSLLKAGQVVRVPKSRASAPPAARPSPAPPAPPPPAVSVPPSLPRQPVAPAPTAPADRTAPSASAIPPGGTYEGSATVILSASDDTDPTPVIRYTLDGTAPDARAQRYDGPLRVEKTATLRYAAWDAAGNVSATRAETYTIAVPEKYREERQWIAQGDYARALQSLEAALARDAEDTQARELLVSASLSHARHLGGEGRWAEAQGVLEKAAAAAPGDSGVQAKLREAERRVGVEQIYQNGVRAAQTGEPEKAYSAFQKALELDPGHGPAKEGLAQVRRDAVEVHSKRALAAFRRQELDVAISKWDQVLAIDPDNELAKLRRAEAVDLKARFEMLQKKGAQ